MLEVYNISWRNTAKAAVALGYFDGVHIAHQSLISQMCAYAQDNNLEKAVFTFTKSVTLGHKGKDILTPASKLEIMRNMGVDLYYSPDFLDFSSLTPEEFVQKILVESMGAQAVFCGENFFFGKNRRGNVQVLKELCSKYNIEFIQAETVCLDGEVVSSTAIRNALSEGNMEKARAMGTGALAITGKIDFYGKSGFVVSKTRGIRYEDAPEADYFLIAELEPGFLDGITGTYRDPAGYFVDEAEAEAFDAQFPPKEKQKIPGQLF